MSAQKLLQKVKMLEKVLAPPQPDRSIEIIWMFPMNSHRNHGAYGHQKTTHNLNNGEVIDYEAVPEDEEVQLLKSYYEEKVPDHSKRQFDGFSWATFEDFLKASRCKCGYHKLEWRREQK